MFKRLSSVIVLLIFLSVDCRSQLAAAAAASTEPPSPPPPNSSFQALSTRWLPTLLHEKIFSKQLLSKFVSNNNKKHHKRCHDYEHASQRSSYTIDMHFMPAAYTGNASLASGDITLSLQFSLARMYMLEPVAEHWPGPIVFVFFGTRAESERLRKFVHDESAVLAPRTNIAYRHVAYSDPLSALQFYPINLLRNIALENITTPYVTSMDVDLVVRRGFYEAMKLRLQTIDPKKVQKLIFIIVAIVTTDKSTDAASRQKFLNIFPDNKKKLMELWLRDNIFLPFGYANTTQHVYDYYGPTDFERWKFATKNPYEVKYAWKFEPTILHRALPLGTPLSAQCGPFTAKFGFSEEFAVFGDNKQTLAAQFAASGYKFVVLADEFALHLPHEKSVAKTTNSKSYKCTRRLDVLFALRLLNTCAAFFEKSTLHRESCKFNDDNFDEGNCKIF